MSWTSQNGTSFFGNKTSVKKLKHRIVLCRNKNVQPVDWVPGEEIDSLVSMLNVQKAFQIVVACIY